MSEEVNVFLISEAKMFILHNYILLSKIFGVKNVNLICMNKKKKDPETLVRYCNNRQIREVVNYLACWFETGVEAGFPISSCCQQST